EYDGPQPAICKSVDDNRFRAFAMNIERNLLSLRVGWGIRPRRRPVFQRLAFPFISNHRRSSSFVVVEVYNGACNSFPVGDRLYLTGNDIPRYTQQDEPDQFK